MGSPLIDSPNAHGGASSPWDGEVFVFPATVGQQGFWFLDQLEPGNPAYNIAVRFSLRGPLDESALARAINAIVDRHEALRTVVMDVDGSPVQIVAPSLEIPVPVTDLTHLAAAERAAQSEILTVEEARRRFCLSAGPLARASLLRLADQEHVLLVTVHHIISDGWSIGVITNELGVLYEAFCRGVESPLEELSLQFGDFAVWQKKWLESGNLDSQLAYWSERLANLPMLEVATDQPRPPVQTSNGHIESLVLPTSLTDELKEFANRSGVTFYMLSLAVLKVMLARVTGQSDIFVGTLVAGRSRVELEPLIGLFINPLVLRTNLGDDPTFVELLEKVRDTVVGALANQDLPFERVVEAVQPRRDPSRHPVFQINFIYQRDFVRPIEAAGLELTALPSRSAGAIYDLNFFMVERADGWRASCEYNTDLYAAETVTNLLERFQALMRGVAADPSRRISQLPMLTSVDRAAWLPATGRNPQSLNGHANHAPTHRDVVTVVAPRDQIETRLLAVWERLLGVRSISVTTDFFDAGGHSLLAARLLAEIERTFHKRITIAAFLKSPTIEAVAERIRKERQGNLQDQLFPLQPNGNRPPLVLQTGQPHIWRPLVERLGPDQPVHCLFFPDASSLPDPTSVEQVATTLIESLRAVLPNGPYMLAGWCRSGVIVYEMAQQLRAAGEDVPLVVLFDTYSPTYLRTFQGLKALPVRLYFKGQKLIYLFGNFRQIGMRAILKMFTSRLPSLPEKWTRWFSCEDLPLASREVVEHVQPANHQYQITETYVPKPYGGKVFLFRSNLHQTGRFRDPELGWGKLARGGLEVHELPGDHQAMFNEPVVRLMSNAMAEQLENLADRPRVSRPVDRPTSSAAVSALN